MATRELFCVQEEKRFNRRGSRRRREAGSWPTCLGPVLSLACVTCVAIEVASDPQVYPLLLGDVGPEEALESII